jgi:hypothetical protein
MDQPNVAKCSAGSKALLSRLASKVFPKLKLAPVGKRASVETAPTLDGGAAIVKGCDVGTTYHFGAAAPSKQLAAERAKFAGGTAPYYYPDSAEARARASVEEFGASDATLEKAVAEFHHGDARILVLAPELFAEDRRRLSLDPRFSIEVGGKKVKNRVVVRCYKCECWEFVAWNHHGWNTQKVAKGGAVRCIWGKDERTIVAYPQSACFNPNCPGVLARLAEKQVVAQTPEDVKKKGCSYWINHSCEEFVERWPEEVKGKYEVMLMTRRGADSSLSSAVLFSRATFAEQARTLAGPYRTKAVTKFLRCQSFLSLLIGETKEYGSDDDVANMRALCAKHAPCEVDLMDDSKFAGKGPTSETLRSIFDVTMGTVRRFLQLDAASITPGSWARSDASPRVALRMTNGAEETPGTHWIAMNAKGHTSSPSSTRGFRI